MSATVGGDDAAAALTWQALVGIHLREERRGMMRDRRALLEIIRRRSFRQGGAFKLASGRTSTIYFNLKPAMLDPEGARLIGAALAERSADLGADYVGGLELGAVPLVAAAAAMSAVGGRPVRAVFVRKAAKEHGTQSLIEGLAEGEAWRGRTSLSWRT